MKAEGVIQDYMVSAFKDHELIEVEKGEKTQYFLMRKPGTGMYTVHIIFAAGHIFLTGDCTVGTRNGCVPNGGYGLAWFKGRKSPDYLCEKFAIPNVWEADRCIESLRHYIEKADDYGYDEDQVAQIKEVIEEMEGGEMHEYAAYEALFDIDQGLVDDGLPGRGYCSRDMGWLSAIQTKFAELYAAKYEQAAEPVHS